MGGWETGNAEEVRATVTSNRRFYWPDLPHEKRAGDSWRSRPPSISYIRVALDAGELALAALRTGHLRRHRPAGPCRRPLHLLLQPVASDVQTPLDGADGRLEVAAHLLQRLTADVEGDQGGPIDRLQPLQPPPQLLAQLGPDHLVQGRGAGRLGVLQHVLLDPVQRTTPRHA